MDDATRFSSSDESSPDDDEFELSGTDASGAGADLVGMLGDYLLLEEIGAGGMGKVYRAEHRTMNREVAIKILNRTIAERQDLLQQFFSEIRAVAKLMHPNIVTAFDAGSAGEMHYLVMELVEGETLSARVRRLGPLSAAESVRVLVQAAKALAYAHRIGIVHRDIKPGNLMVTQQGILKILDFGLARLGSRVDSQTANMFMGTPEYMSPEQIENPDAVDGRSDLYSLGGTLYFILTGQPMFTGEKMQVARAQLRQKPTPLFVARSDVDLRLDAVFQRLIAKQPVDRYANAEDLLDSLDKLNLTSQPGTASASKKSGALGPSYRMAGDNPTSVAYDSSTLTKKSQIVGIDLGLLVSTAAYYDPVLGPQLIPHGQGNSRHLRNMLWSSGERIKVGEEAVALRKTEPENVLHSIQRRFGLKEVLRPFGGEKVPPEVILAAVLRQIMHSASTLVEQSSSAIVTVPSCYDQLHRRAVRNACHIAGIQLVQLLDKPLAAALSWLDLSMRLSVADGPQAATDAKLLIVHLGGSGLEASVVHAQGLVAKQMGVCGHWQMGTQRWQQLLTEYFSSALKDQTGKLVREDVAAATRLQRTIELAIDRLTRTSRVDIRFDWLNASIQQTVTQDGLVKIAPNLTKSLQQSIAMALRNAKVDASEIDCILVAGSMMQMKPVQRIVKATIPHNVRLTVLEKAEFARGAAIQANFVSSLSTKDSLHARAVGCTAYDIALLVESTRSGLLKPRILLEGATPLPTSILRTIRPKPPQGEDGAFASLQLIESTSLGEGNWGTLGKVKPELVFPKRQSDEPLQLRLEVDENGILESSLVWPAGSQQIRMPESSEGGLSENDLDRWRDWLETVMLCSDC